MLNENTERSDEKMFWEKCADCGQCLGLITGLILAGYEAAINWSEIENAYPEPWGRILAALASASTLLVSGWAGYQAGRYGFGLLGCTTQCCCSLFGGKPINETPSNYGAMRYENPQFSDQRPGLTQ